jgi:hypothetical protein
MQKNDNPLFALLPASVLAKAKSLSNDLRIEDELKDLAGRSTIKLAIVITFLTGLNGANAYAFGTTTIGLIGKSNPSLLFATWAYALVIGFGGLIWMFEGLMAWLELLVRRRIDPLSAPRARDAAFYRRSTWLPLIPISLLPALFNACFSLTFFMASVACLLAFVMLFSLLSHD